MIMPIFRNLSIIAILLLPCVPQTVFSQSGGSQRLLVSAGGKILHFSVDLDSGALVKEEEIDFGQTGVMTISPDGKTIYLQTALPTQTPDETKQENAKGKKPTKVKSKNKNRPAKTPAIATLQLTEQGKLQEIHRAPSGSSAGYLKTDAKGKFLAGSNYGAGHVSIWELDAQGKFAGKTVRTFELERCSHSAFFSPDNKSLYVPATCPNKIFQLKFDDQTGEIVPRQPSSANGPQNPEEASQPRHLIFHPDKPLAYTTHERERAGAGVYRWDPESGTLSLLQSIVSVDPQDEEGMTTADLHLSPDSRLLFVSNRDIANRKNPNKGRDSIATFTVDEEDGQLTLLGRSPCPKVPRSFCLDASGKFLFVGGQGDFLLASYRIDKESGQLTEIGNRIPLPGSPSWLLCLSAP